MHISLTKDSDVPLRQQLAEQIVFLITTGQLGPGEEMPSVRALARRVKVHHNTVSDAYRDLVRRGWVTRRPGSRLTVGAPSAADLRVPSDLDELINQTIETAKRMGYSLQALRECARERLLAQPPDHILVVEEEDGLREIIQHEIQQELGWLVEGCSREDFVREPGLAIGAQVLAPNHIIEELKSLIAPSRPSISITYSRADDHVRRIRALETPSIIAVVSVSAVLLKTARGLLAQAVGRKHTFQEFLVSTSERVELAAADLVFCDSLAINYVSSRHKIRYQLIPSNGIEQIAATLISDL